MISTNVTLKLALVPSVIDILAHTLENGVSSSVGIDSPENLPNFSPTKHLYFTNNKLEAIWVSLYLMGIKMSGSEL